MTFEIRSRWGQVRYGSVADFRPPIELVRFESVNGHGRVPLRSTELARLRMKSATGSMHSSVSFLTLLTARLTAHASMAGLFAIAR